MFKNFQDGYFLKTIKTKRFRGLAWALAIVMIAGFISGGVFMPSELKAAPANAPTRGQVSSVKFIQAETNYLGGLALDADGKVWTWGYNAYGMLGTRTREGGYAGGMERVPYFVDNNIKVVQIAGGYHTSYALDENGVLYAWGRGLEGQMGNNTVTVNNPKPVIVTSLNGIRIKKVVTTTEAASATYAIAENGAVYAWGYADGYRIRGASGYQRTAKLMTDFNDIDIADIDMGDNHGVVLDTLGQVWTWGAGNYGKLGHGNTTIYEKPKRVEFFDGKGRVVKISAESSTSMAVTADGKAYIWGAFYEATGNTRTSYVNLDGSTMVYSPSGRLVSQTTPKLIEFDLTSASDYGYTQKPAAASVAAGRYVNYVVDVYGRVWYFGWNTFYGFATDGPLFTTTNGGKHSTYVTNATLLRTMGDGDTQGYMRTGNPNTDMKGPVFSGAVSTSQFTESFQSYRIHGQWSEMQDGLHPTIYDKKYMETTAVPSGATSHTNVYPLDKDGNRLVYVIMRQGASSSTYRYSGNFYKASNSYTGSWILPASGATPLTSLPAGVTTATSTPVVKAEERDWIGFSVGLDSNGTFDYTGSKLKDVPYISAVSTYQSAVLFIDNSGNLLKQSLDGSGSIAWGWDYTIYERRTAGNNANYGLYNFYNYEIMFMRGMPGGKTPDPIKDFEKKADRSKYLKHVSNQEATYTISFTMPSDVSEIESVRIVDVDESGYLGYTIGSAVVKVDGVALSAADFMVDLSVTDEVGVIIPGGMLANNAEVAITLTFMIAGNAEGTLRNSAFIYVKPVGGDEPDDPDGETDVEIEDSDYPKIEDFAKTANRSTYLNRVSNQEATYTISFTLPADVSVIESLRIKDIDASGYLDYMIGSAVVKVNGVSFATGFTVDTSVAGAVSVIIPGGMLVNDAAVEVTLTFVIDENAQGTLRNNAFIYVTPLGGVEPTVPDDEAQAEIEEKDLKIKNFTKTAGKSTYLRGVSNQEATYTISFTMPEDVSVIERVRIVDFDESGYLHYVIGSAVVKVNNVPLVTGFTVDASAPGKVDVIIPGDLLANNAAVAITLTFVIDENAHGKLRNNALIYVTPRGGSEPPDPDDETDVEIEDSDYPKIEDFAKTADRSTYLKGVSNQEATYTISFKLPSDVSEIESLRIEDIDATSVGYLNYIIGSAVVEVDGVSLTGFTVYTSVAGAVNVIIPGGLLANDAVVEVQLTFAIDENAQGTLLNNAFIYVTPVGGVEPTNPDGEDQAEIEEFPKIKNLEKTANRAIYFRRLSNQEAIYTISFTMPENVSEIESVRIVDADESGYLHYTIGSAVVKVNGISLANGFTVVTSVAGEVSVIIPGNLLANNATVAITLTFVIDTNARGTLRNSAFIYVTPRDGSEPPDPDSGTSVDIKEYDGPS